MENINGIKIDGEYTPIREIEVQKVNYPLEIVDIIEKDNLKVFSNDFITQIGNALMMYADELVSASSNTCLRIKTQVFSHCYKLQHINFPKVTRINDNGFLDCYSLESVEFPELISMGNSVFEFNNDGGAGYTPSLKTVNIPKAHFVGLNSFRGCSSLEEFNAPKIKGIGNYCFTNCTGISELNLPELQYAGKQFLNGSGIKKLIVPKLEGIYNNISYDIATDAINASDKISVPYFSDLTRLEELELGGMDNVPGMLEGLNSLKKITLGSCGDGVFGKYWNASATFENQNDYVPSTLKEVIVDGVISTSQWNTFRGCTNIEKITMKNTTLMYRNSLRATFYGMTNLKRVDGIFETDRDGSASSTFMNCTNLEKVGLIRFSSDIALPISMFDNCKKIDDISITSNSIGSKLIIANSAFSGCSSLYNITFSFVNECGDIGTGLFNGITHPVTIHINNGGFYIDYDSFMEKFAPYIQSGAVILNIA